MSPGEVINSVPSEEVPAASVTLEGVTASVKLGKSGPVGVSLEKPSNTVPEGYNWVMEVILTLKKGHLGKKGF